MRKIEAILEASDLSPLVQGLAAHYLYGFTLSRVSFGFGQLERGFKLEMVVRENIVPEVLDLLFNLRIPAAKWRDRGLGPDVTPVEDSVRIRTGEEGPEALLYLC